MRERRGGSKDVDLTVTKIPKAFVMGALPCEGLGSAGHPFVAEVGRVAMQSVEGIEATWYRCHLPLLPIGRSQLPAGKRRGQSLLTWTLLRLLSCCLE